MIKQICLVYLRNPTSAIQKSSPNIHNIANKRTIFFHEWNGTENHRERKETNEFILHFCSKR